MYKKHETRRNDIRGKKFFSASLMGEDFEGAKAGITSEVTLYILVASLLLSLLSGFIAAYSGAILGHFFSGQESSSITVGWVVFIILFGLWQTILRIGMGSALGFLSLVIAMTIVISVGLVPDGDIAAKTAVSNLSAGGSIASIVGLALAIDLSHKTNLCIFTTVLGIFLGTVFGIPQQNTYADFAGVALVSGVTLVLASIIARAISRESDKRYQLIHDLATTISIFGGTSFKNADLTNANFTNANLRNTDFRGANLTRTNWRNAKNLDRANLERTYLENPTIRNLLTGGNGQDQDLQKLDLSNLNLDNANLGGTDLRNANLNNSTLRYANLSRAKLAQAQLYGADLTGANLTGAFIQNWGISPETIFDDVQCDYIYMRLPTDQDPDPCRKPDNKSETFRPGDFADFIAPIIRTLGSYQQQNLDPRNLLAPKTLDLYHYDGIDPSATTVALQQLIESNPQAEIEVRAIEGRGYQKVRIQAQVANSADPSQLNADYFDRYQELATLAYPDLQNLLNGLEAKDSRIRSLESMVKNALGSDRFYAEAIQLVTQPKNILILAANPKNSTRLRIDEEVREIQNGLDRARNRDKFLLQQRWAITVRDLRRAFLDCQPNIVHFSGHGLGTQADSAGEHRDIAIATDPHSPEGIFLEDNQGNAHLVPGSALANLFKIFANDIDCLVLNACYSETQANAIVQHIPYVIGMNQAIGDRAAIEFSIGFYDGLLAGKPIETAYQLGCNAIQLQGIPEHLTPVLKQRDA